MHAITYCEQNLSFAHPDHLCFDRTTYDNINGPSMFDIIGPAGPLMYPDQISRERNVRHDKRAAVAYEMYTCFKKP